MTAYRTASFFRVTTYLRIRGTKEPLGFFRIRNINPIKQDLLDLRITPTIDGKDFLIHVEDHDCSKLPNELRYIDADTAKNICQFIIDNSAGSRIHVMSDEQDIWHTLFGKINYDVSFTISNTLSFGGLNGHDLKL